MAFFETLGLYVCGVVLCAMLVGYWLRSVQPYRILPAAAPALPNPPDACPTFIESGAHQCLWKCDGPRPCGLNCVLERCRMEDPAVVGTVARPASPWKRETLIVLPYPSTH